MNLFQKDLSLFQDEMMKNRQSYETVKTKKDKKESERINLSLEIYDVESKIAEYKVMKNRRLRANKRIKKLKQNRALFLLIFILGILGSLGFCLATNLLGFLAAIPIFGGLSIFTSSVYKNKINNLIKERNEFSENKTIKELNSIIETFEKESNTKKLMQKDLEDLINLYYEDMNKIDSDASKIHKNYKFVLDLYQAALEKVDPNVTYDELVQIINKEHANAMPVMVKTIFGKKNV